MSADEFLSLFGCTKSQSKSLERKISLIKERPDNHKIMVSIKGKRLLFSDAHRKYGKVKWQTAYNRFCKGWSVLDSLTLPLHCTYNRVQ